MNNVKRIISENIASVSFADITLCTEVKLSAASSKAGNSAWKRSTWNIQLFRSAIDYEHTVLRSAQKLGQDVSEFIVSESWMFHDTDVFSIVYSKKRTIRISI